MDFGIATVVAITALVYIICLCVKASVLDNKWIPVIAGVSGRCYPGDCGPVCRRN